MHDHISQSSQQFPTTQWSLIARAADLDPAVRREALGHLLTRYLPVFSFYLRRRGIPAEQIDDLVQSFACDRIVNDGLITRAEKSKGRLRNYLLKSLNHHILMMRRHDSAMSRSPGTPLAGLDDAAEIESCEADASAAFDVAWAKRVVASAVEGMQRECGASGKERIWRVFELRTLEPILNGAQPIAYEDIAAQYGFRSALEAANALVTGKRMFARVLRSIVEEYSEGAEVEDELRELRSILATHGSSATRALGI